MSETGDSVETEQSETSDGIVAAEVQQIRDSAEDLNFLAALAIPEIMEFPFPPIYLYLFQTLTEKFKKIRDFSKFALGLPRGHGKTIFLKLLILYIILFTKRKFILIVAAKDNMAEAILADVADMLDEVNIRQTFGNWRENLEQDRGSSKKFRFMGRNIIIKAIGFNSSFRGVNEKFSRPDVMIFDDAQTRECALSETQAEEFIDKFNSTALKTKAHNGCTFLYVGNMYRDFVVKEVAGKKIYGCQLRNLKENPVWESIIVGGILADGKALWEDLQPLEQLIQEFRDDLASGNPESFFAEVLNDPKGGILKHFDFSKVKAYPYGDEFPPEGKFIMIDPSLGKKKSDDQAVNLYYVYDGIPWLREVRVIQKSAPDMVKDVLDWAIAERVPLVCAEDVAYQATLIQWFEKWAQEIGLSGIEFKGVNRGRMSKNGDILSMLKDLQSGELGLHPDTASEIFDQIAFFDPTKTNNRDDKIDNMAYARRIYEQFSYETMMHIESYNSSSLGLPAVIDAGGVN